MAYLIIAGAIQGLILTVILITHETANRKANLFLALLTGVYSIDILLELFNSSSRVMVFPHFVGVIDPLLFLYGPLLYLYTCTLTNPSRNKKGKTVLHFLPSLFLFCWYIPALFLQSPESKLFAAAFIESAGNVSPFAVTYVFRDTLWIISCIHEIVYIVFSLLVLRRYSITIQNVYSSLEKINLRWLKILLIATGWSVGISMAFALTLNYNLLPFEDALKIILICSAGIIYLIGYMGLRQPEIFIQGRTDAPGGEVVQREKYAKSKLDDHRLERYTKKLQLLMNKEKLYLQPNLKLKEVADRLSISTNNLSQVINNKLEKNFFDYINSFRIEDAQKMILDPAMQHLTLLAIAQDVGFNSKSSFNTVFKKLTSKTPSEFRNENQSSS